MIANTTAIAFYIQKDNWDEYAFWLMLRNLQGTNYADEGARMAAVYAVIHANSAARRHIIFALTQLENLKRPSVPYENPRPEFDGQGQDFFKPVVAVLSGFDDDPDIRAILFKFLRDNDPEKRFYATTALFDKGLLNGEILRIQLEDPNFTVRLNAAHLLARLVIQIGASDVMPPLARKLFEQECALAELKDNERALASLTINTR